MSTIASCPRCAQQITIPGGVASSETVRCPLCNAEYQLADALAKAPPTLIVVSSLAVVAPASPSAENESELHLFPAAESPYDFADVGSGSNELPVDEAQGPFADTHAAPLDTHPDSHEAPLMAELHGLDVGDHSGGDFGPAEADLLELPSDNLSEAHADAGEHALPELQLGDSSDSAFEHPVAETTESDFLSSFDDSEPPVGADEEELPISAGHLPGQEPPHEPDFGAAEQGEEELSFDDDEESFGIESGETASSESINLDSGVNLDSGFEERRPIPENVEGYALDHEPAEVEASEEELALIADKPSRAARRKPSFLIGAIMYLLGLFVILPLTYLGLMWGASMDPLKLAPALPGFIVPAALNIKTQMARSIPASDLKPAATGDPIENALRAQGGAPADAPAGGNAPNGGAPAGDNTPADDAKSTAEEDADLLGDLPAGDAPDTDAGEMDPADAAAADADAATHDPDASPSDLDTANSDAADTVPGDADEMPADRDATADSEPADSDVADTEPAESDVADAAPKEEDMADDNRPAKELADSDADEMPAEPDAAADSSPAETDVAESADKDSDPDDADDATPKKTAKSAADEDSPVGAALDAAMVDDDAADAAAVGPRDSVEYTPADVNQALTEVASASKALDEAADADRKKTKGQFYRKLYRLAEVATFTPSMAGAGEAEQGSQQDLVDHTLVGAAASPTKFDEVGKAAAKWLAAVKGKEHQGIVLSGTLQSTTQRGKVFESQVLLTDGQNVVTVLSPAAPSAGKLSSVLVWGTVADDPAQNIAGYDGEAKTAVWTTAVEQAPSSAASKPTAPGSQPTSPTAGK